MRNHIIFKFLAIALCAAALLSAVAGGVGIFVMTESGLYEKNVDELYQEQLESYALNYAIDRWEMYASQNLGGAGEELAEFFYQAWYRYNNFRPGRVGYILRDPEGNVVLEEHLGEGVPAKYTYSFSLDYPFLNVLSEEPYVEGHPTEATMPPEIHITHIDDTYVYDAVPERGAAVYFLSVRYEDGSEVGLGSPDSPMGMLRRLEDGTIVMDPVEDMGDLEWMEQPVWILFMDRDRNILYEASSSDGVVEESRWQETVGLFLRLRKLTEEAFVMDAIPPEGCSVKRVAVTYEDGTGESAGGTPDIGVLEYNEQGGIRFTANDAHLLLQQGGKIIHIAFYDENEEMVYEARNPEGVGYLYTFDNKQIFITAQPEVLETIPEVTIPVETRPVYREENEPSVAATEAVIVPEGKPDDIFRYYSNDAQQRMEVEYTMESVPGYTMEVQLAAKPLQREGDWVLVRTLYAFRNWLPVLLGAGLLLFAVTAVYLCCAAARKPKSEDVRPGGLNCIPLDLYLAMAGFGVVGLAFLAVEAIPEILGELRVVLVVGGLLAYCASLLIVGFCFACAAQFKTPGGYWWRHSVCGFCVKLLGKLFRLLIGILRRMVAFWREKLWPGIKTLVRAIFALTMRLLKKIGRWLKKTGKTIGRKMNRVYSLLPVTWQWMSVGFGMILLLFLVIFNRRNTLLLLLGLGVAFGVVAYGAHCFGLLLESAKRMSKGNLEEKVDDKLMTGSFKEFAGELNGLADVAVVAAQKQLKSERMKTELITNVSHDIKTPLTSIINYVDLLQKPHSPEEGEKYLEVLDRQSQRLKKLIDDLMEMSKASTGNLAVEIGRVDAAETVNQALGEFADKLEKAQLYPVFRQPEEPVLMLADGRLVWRVMSNLLSNAVKYALPGTRLYVDLQKLENKVILSLKNISREELNVQADELLERFVRGDVSRNTEGSGLGLNIARSLMELQKGQLQILVDGDLFKVTLIFPAAE